MINTPKRKWLKTRATFLGGGHNSAIWAGEQGQFVSAAHSLSGAAWLGLEDLNQFCSCLNSAGDVGMAWGWLGLSQAEWFDFFIRWLTSKRKKRQLQDLLHLTPRSHTMSLLSESMGQSKWQDQPRVQGREKKRWVSIWENEKVLEMGGGGGYTTMWM